MNNYNMNKFQNDVQAMGITLEEEQYQQFLFYYELLMKWNSVMNLTAITDFDDVITKHFIDSLSLIKSADLSKKMDVIDVGTGAGFPGIPLKIAFPNLEITLLDSLNKRVKFLNEVINTLKLESVKAIHGRAEDFAINMEYREGYDLCVSRAVANLSTLSEYCLPFVKIGGNFISYKSEKSSEEISNANHGISILGGKIKDQIEFNLPGTDIYRKLIKIEKVKKTPKSYPRKAGLPSKEPLK